MGQGVELAQPFRGGDIRGLSLDREQPGTRRLDQKVVLVGEAGHPQSGTFGRFRDPGEIDVRGDVLPSGRGEGILPRTVGVVAAQGAPAAGGGVVLVPFVSVVDDPPDSLLREKGRAFRHPAIDRRSDLGVVVIGKIVAEALREITERRRERPEHPGEAIAVFVLSDTAFVPNPFPVEETMKGERVEELVAQKDPAGRYRRRDVADDLDAVRLGVGRERLCQRPPHLGAGLEDAVDRLVREGRVDLAESRHHIPREPTVVRALLHDHRWRAAGKPLVPFAVDRPGEEKSKGAPDRDARVKIPFPPDHPGKGLRIVPVFFMIQNLLHELRERNREVGTFRYSLKDEIEKERILRACGVSFRCFVHRTPP